MSSKQIIIYGAGPLAELMHYNFTHDSDYEVIAFCVDKDYLTCTTLCDLPVVEFETVATLYPPDTFSMFVAIGYSRMRNRPILFDKAKQKGYRLVNFISQHALLRENLIIGENNCILSSCDIDPFVRIGNNNVIWTGSIVGHHATIGDHNYISGNCGVGGLSVMGNLCFMGNTAVTVNSVKIANESYLVSGTAILKDTQEACMYHGNPAKLVSRHPDTGIIIK